MPDPAPPPTAIDHSTEFDPTTAVRPVPALLKYYFFISLFGMVAFPILMLVHFFKYETLRYSFDAEGIRMSWGILFRREINLTYRRIQDIHLTRNIIQRWMGLATVSVQTASGSSGPEMQIEGIRNYDALRDFLYTKMRGAKGETEHAPATPSAAAPADEALTLLREIRDQLAGLNTERRR